MWFIALRGFIGTQTALNSISCCLLLLLFEPAFTFIHQSTMAALNALTAGPSSCDSPHLMKNICFSTVSQLLTKIRTAKTPKLKLEILKKYIDRFQAYRDKFQESNKDADCSFFHILRLLLPKVDRERESYGIKHTSMGELYIRSFAFSATSREAKMLTTEQGFNKNCSDYADVVFNVIKDRCPRESSLTVYELNEYLNTIADKESNREGKR